MAKPSIVFERRKGNVIGVYGDDAVQVILVDYDDEDEGPASIEIIPAPSVEMSVETRRLAADAIERAK